MTPPAPPAAQGCRPSTALYRQAQQHKDSEEAHAKSRDYSQEQYTTTLWPQEA